MKKLFLCLFVAIGCKPLCAQVSFPFQGFNLMPVETYYTDMAINATWNNGWKYLSKGPCVKLTFGEWNLKSDYVFQTAPVHAGEPGELIPFKEVMRICENGSVGIGTATPGSYKLAVEGTIGARKVKVMQGSWADFVFDASYALPPLSEVEAHVKSYKHLPGIPSAKEISVDGLDVGDMQTKQMQKIEELTLYLIEQDKMMKSQQELIRRQQALIDGLEKRVAAVENKQGLK